MQQKWALRPRGEDIRSEKTAILAIELTVSLERYAWTKLVVRLASSSRIGKVPITEYIYLGRVFSPAISAMLTAAALSLTPWTVAPPVGERAFGWLRPA